MDSAVPAVVVAQRDGALVSQNTPACRLMGAGLAKPCWAVVGGLEEAEGLPCQHGCVNRLLALGLENTQRVDVRLDGRDHRLTCIPVEDLVVCVLNRTAENDPEKWQRLTAREQTVLSLLALGDETPAVAKKLKISESTVRTHVEKMRSKRGVGTRAALVALGFRLGYLK